jgi:CheY-like chemotaxis protein
VFRILLPLVDGPPPVIALRPPATPGKRLRLLIIDDERSLVDALRILLSDVHDVKLTTSARDAIGQIESGAMFDVILCDMMMPDVDGMAFYARLRQIAPSLVARIGFLTGGAFTRANREFLEGVPHLEKPFDISALLGLIATLAEASPS